MQPKKNLTNAQRVMLDKLYTKQFELKREEVRVKRDQAYTKMAEFAKARFEKQPQIAKAIKLANEFNKQLKSIDFQALADEGMGFYTTDAKIQVSAYGRSTYGYDTHAEAPELTAFKAETTAINTKLNNAESEMRLRIFGSDTTYAEIEAEINAILKGVSL